MEKFDRNIKSLLDAYPSAGYEHLWEGVEQSLPPVRRKKRYLFLIPLLAGVLFISGVWAIVLNDQNNPPAAHSNMTISSQNSNPSPVQPSQAAAPSEGFEMKDPESARSDVNNRLERKSISALGSLKRTIIGPKEEAPDLPLQIIQLQTRNEEIVSDLAQLNFRTNPISGKKDLIPAIAEDMFVDPTDCPGFSDRESRWAMEVYVNQFLPFQQLSNLNMETNDYINSRNTTESPLYSFGGGARLTYYLNNKIFVKAGVDYSVLREKFRYDDPTTLQTRTVITIDTIFTPTGPQVTIDTSYIRIPGSRTIQEVNTLRRFNFPITLGMEKSLSSFNISAHAGLLLNLTTYSEGIILDPMSNPVEYGDGSMPDFQLFKKSIQWSALAGLTIEYTGLGSISLFAEPQIRYSLGNLVNDTYPLSQKYLETGILFGVRKSF